MTANKLTTVERIAMQVAGETSELDEAAAIACGYMLSEVRDIIWECTPANADIRADLLSEVESLDKISTAKTNKLIHCPACMAPLIEIICVSAARLACDARPIPYENLETGASVVTAEGIEIPSVKPNELLSRIHSRTVCYRPHKCEGK